MRDWAVLESSQVWQFCAKADVAGATGMSADTKLHLAAWHRKCETANVELLSADAKTTGQSP